MSDTVSALNAAQNLDDLYKVFAANRYTAGWHKARPSLWREPRTGFTPQHWRYRDAAVALERAGEWIGTELAERRNLLMFNPVGDNDYATVRTLVAAYQMIKPGEHARAHRHTPNALRLVLDARPGLYTVVDGIRLPMNPGDVLLTPNWCWHSHYNEGKHSAIWLDFLDVPLVHLLEPDVLRGVSRRHSAGDVGAQRKPVLVRHRLGARGIAEGARRERRAPPHAAEPAAHSHHGAHLSPHADRRAPGERAQHGEPHLRGGRWRRQREDRRPRCRWERGDVLAVPSWTAFEIGAAQDTLLFEVSDEPVLQALNFLRNDPRSIQPTAST